MRDRATKLFIISILAILSTPSAVVRADEPDPDFKQFLELQFKTIARMPVGFLDKGSIDVNEIAHIASLLKQPTYLGTSPAQTVSERMQVLGGFYAGFFQHFKEKIALYEPYRTGPKKTIPSKWLKNDSEIKAITAQAREVLLAVTLLNFHAMGLLDRLDRIEQINDPSANPHFQKPALAILLVLGVLGYRFLPPSINKENLIPPALAVYLSALGYAHHKAKKSFEANFLNSAELQAFLEEASQNGLPFPKKKAKDFFLRLTRVCENHLIYNHQMGTMR